MKTIKVTRDGRPATAEELQNAVEGKPLTTPKKTRTPRTVSPEVEAIRAEARDKIQALNDSKASGRMLQTIVEKRLPKMNKEHRQELFDVLAHEFTPALLKE